MTDHAKKLAEIEARAKKATEGPWVRQNPWPMTENQLTEGYCGNQDYITSADGTEIISCDSGIYGPSEPDAEFVIHSREDVPYLIARVRELEGALGFYADSTHWTHTAASGLIGPAACDAGDYARRALGVKP